MAMKDPEFGRYKAFLIVGVAYFIVAVLAPLILLKAQGASWSFPSKGAWISLFAGTLGAIGAFGVLLAFGAKGAPAVVMSIVFAGAPIVNAIAGMLMHPPKGGIAAVPWQFYLGIAMAATGGCLVSYYKPPAAQAAKSPNPGSTATARPH
jgi:drug/metabolite transporter (DMT)-like permease